jgi:hypothetical protein
MVDIVKDLVIRSRESLSITIGVNQNELPSGGACLAFRGIHPCVVVLYSDIAFLFTRNCEGKGLGITVVIQNFVITGMIGVRIIRDMKL